MSRCSRAKILGDKSWRGRQLSIKIVARRRIKVNVAGRRRKKEKKKKKEIEGMEKRKKRGKKIDDSLSSIGYSSSSYPGYENERSDEKERRMNVENENGRVFQGTHQGCILDLEHIDGAIFFFSSSSSSLFSRSSPVQSRKRNIRITVDFFYVLLLR